MKRGGVVLLVVGLAASTLALAPASAAPGGPGQCVPSRRPILPPILRPIGVLFSRRTDVRPTDPNGPQGQWLRDVLQLVQTSAIAGRTYVANTYDCDDFASDHERRLQRLGYDATFTVYFCPPPHNYPAGSRAGAHAVTDVHAPDGTVAWIDNRGRLMNMDFDGDGFVTHSLVARNPALDFPTDGDCRIEVYEDRGSVPASRPLDLAD